MSHPLWFSPFPLFHSQFPGRYPVPHFCTISYLNLVPLRSFLEILNNGHFIQITVKLKNYCSHFIDEEIKVDIRKLNEDNTLIRCGERIRMSPATKPTGKAIGTHQAANPPGSRSTSEPKREHDTAVGSWSLLGFCFCCCCGSDGRASACSQALSPPWPWQLSTFLFAQFNHWPVAPELLDLALPYFYSPPPGKTHVTGAQFIIF